MKDEVIHRTRMQREIHARNGLLQQLVQQSWGGGGLGGWLYQPGCCGRFHHKKHDAEAGTVDRQIAVKEIFHRGLHGGSGRCRGRLGRVARGGRGGRGGRVVGQYVPQTDTVHCIVQYCICLACRWVVWVV